MSLCYTWQCAWSRKTSELNAFHHPLLLFTSSCVILPSLFTACVQVFAPEVWLVLPGGARCTFVLLSGPVWAKGVVVVVGMPTEGRGRVYCPYTFHSSKNTVVGEGGMFNRGAGDGWRSTVEFGVVSRFIFPLSLSSCLSPVPSCRWRSCGADECTCLKSTPEGQTPVSPISVRFTQTHVLVSTYKLLKGLLTSNITHVNWDCLKLLEIEPWYITAMPWDRSDPFFKIWAIILHKYFTNSCKEWTILQNKLFIATPTWSLMSN